MAITRQINTLNIKPNVVSMLNIVPRILSSLQRSALFFKTGKSYGEAVYGVDAFGTVTVSTLGNALSAPDTREV